jgi:hypothetical protein
MQHTRATIACLMAANLMFVAESLLDPLQELGIVQTLIHVLYHNSNDII